MSAEADLWAQVQSARPDCPACPADERRDGGVHAHPCGPACWSAIARSIAELSYEVVPNKLLGPIVQARIPYVAVYASKTVRHLWAPAWVHHVGLEQIAPEGARIEVLVACKQDPELRDAVRTLAAGGDIRDALPDLLEAWRQARIAGRR